MRPGALLLFLPVFALSAQTAEPLPSIQPDAAGIMAQVTANVEAAEPARRGYVYRQTVKAALNKTNGKPVRRERREYDVLPGDERTEKILVELEGERYDGDDALLYFAPDDADNIDSSLMRDLVKDLVDDPRSKDGIPRSLFPLRSRDLPRYVFTLLEQTEFRGRPVYKIAFDPVEKDLCVNVGDENGDETEDRKGREGDHDDCDTPWKGEIWVDVEDLQPVRIFTDLARGIPWGVRVFLGTDVEQLGFAITYERIAPNVWFPVSYGTEFRLDVFWFYKRHVTMALESRDFRRTDATSVIDFAGLEAPR